MKGAAVGHAKQRLRDGRYLGLSEPGIIAAEPPNPMVSHLVVMPDIEKRLEGFLRLAHGIVVFPGGVGTAEEILYLLGILSHPDNADIELPLIFAGPEESRSYFEMMDAFIAETLGDEVRARYRIVTGDPQRVARDLLGLMESAQTAREHAAHFFNWQLNIPLEFQQPFEATHESMAALALHDNQPPQALAYNLRRAFSGIVAGNVREAGIRLVEERGPFELSGDPRIIGALDVLLRRFVEQRRMKLSDPGNYVPCYRIVG
jgi:predicted Rossmann-fold nucleotide-binding protein